MAHRHLSPLAYEAMREQVATAVALCSDEQVLDLADALHDTLRRRRLAEARQEVQPPAANVLQMMN